MKRAVNTDTNTKKETKKEMIANEFASHEKEKNTHFEVWNSALLEAKNTLELFMNSKDNISLCMKFTDILCSTFKNKGNVFVCGNGGSHCDAMHFAEEFTGRFDENRKPLGVLALGDPSHTTCVANDFGFDQVFSRQLEALGREGDLLVGLSTSGLSENLIKAFEKAKELKIKSFALLGKSGGVLKNLADFFLVVPSQKSSRIQEIHIKILHTAVESVEKKLFSERWVSG